VGQSLTCLTSGGITVQQSPHDVDVVPWVASPAEVLPEDDIAACVGMLFSCFPLFSKSIVSLQEASDGASGSSPQFTLSAVLTAYLASYVSRCCNYLMKSHVAAGILLSQARLFDLLKSISSTPANITGTSLLEDRNCFIVRCCWYPLSSCLLVTSFCVVVPGQHFPEALPNSTYVDCIACLPA
jgi:hypothetical protein